MACSLVSRLLNHGPLRRLHLRGPPPATSTTLSSQPQPHNTSFGDSINNLLLLNVMAGQSSSTLSALNVLLDPLTSFGEIDQVFYNSEGYIGLASNRQTAQINGPALYDFVYTFRTAADASNALFNHPTILIGGHLYPLALDDISADSPANPTQLDQTQVSLIPPPDSDISPPRKRLKKKNLMAEKKITCIICLGELEGPYSTPCRRCKSPTCYECLSRQFRIAVKDIDRMPVKCCGSVMHHEVARGLLPVAELEDYKQKYDERINTTDPLFCPIPTCSTFIPPRFFKKNIDGKVACHTCNAIICVKCKQQAGDDHTCANDDSRNLIIETFHYKLCPKCGTGVMKMYGCPHVRCSCNAHWCWYCQRPMNACYRSPCQTARNDGSQPHEAGEAFDSDSDSDNEDEDDDPDGRAARQRFLDFMHCTVAAANAAHHAAASAREHDPQVTTSIDDRMAETTEQSLTNSATASNPDTHTTDRPRHRLVIPGIRDADPLDRRRRQEVARVGNSDDSPAPETQQIPTSMDHSDSLEQLGPEQTAIRTDNADRPAPDQAAVPEENLDDPDEYDWEGRDLDLGEEPVDETWDTWGCQHLFEKLGKDRIPKFWLIGVNPATDPSLTVECMGCFQRTKVWDDVAELEAFRAQLANAHGVESNEEDVERKWTEWKAQKTDGAANEPLALSGPRFKKAISSVYDCKHGCGVIYCGACRKESLSRIRKERTAPDFDA